MSSSALVDELVVGDGVVIRGVMVVFARIVADCGWAGDM